MTTLKDIYLAAGGKADLTLPVDQVLIRKDRE